MARMVPRKLLQGDIQTKRRDITPAVLAVLSILLLSIVGLDYAKRHCYTSKKWGCSDEQECKDIGLVSEIFMCLNK